MKKVLTIFLLAICAVITATAQGPVDPVSWRATAKMTSPNRGVITIRATISKGWHLYGMTMPANGPKPTSFDFAGSTGVKFSGNVTPSKAPVKKHDEMFGTDVTYWENSVSFTRQFTVTDSSKAGITLQVSYMGCNDRTCSPPKTKKLTVKIPAYKKSDGTTGTSPKSPTK